MQLASVVSVVLARFSKMRSAPRFDVSGLDSCLFGAVGADQRAAATVGKDRAAFVFVVVALHESESSANRLLDERFERAPWLRESVESFAAVMKPFRHKGEVNYLDRTCPGPVYADLAPAPSPETPFAVMTTVGYVLDENFDPKRVGRFADGVTGVRVSMTGVDGLHSQQSFFLGEGGLTIDPITLTFWRDTASLNAFAYRDGMHKTQMDTARAENLYDRTSFTRFVPLRAEGTWYRTNPFAASG